MPYWGSLPALQVALLKSEPNANPEERTLGMDNHGPGGSGVQAGHTCLATFARQRRTHAQTALWPRCKN